MHSTSESIDNEFAASSESSERQRSKLDLDAWSASLMQQDSFLPAELASRNPRKWCLCDWDGGCGVNSTKASLQPIWSTYIYMISLFYILVPINISIILRYSMINKPAMFSVVAWSCPGPVEIFCSAVLQRGLRSAFKSVPMSSYTA